MANIEAVIFAAKQKSYLAMRRWGTTEQNAAGVSRLDDAAGPVSEFAEEWSEFRSGFLGADAGHHVVSGNNRGETEPYINVLEITEDDGPASTWIARGYRELGAADADEPQIRVVTDQAKAADLAAKALSASACQDDIDAASAEVAVGFSVSFMNTPGASAPMGTALENFGDLEASDD